MTCQIIWIIAALHTLLAPHSYNLYAAAQLNGTFGVTRSTNMILATDVIDFDATTLPNEDSWSGFDLDTDTFTPPVSGLYWLTFSVGTGLGNETDVRLVGSPDGRTPNVIRETIGTTDTSSRCDIVSLTAGVDRLTLSSVGALYSDASGLQTSFNGFNLDTAMDIVAAFSVGRSTPSTVQGYLAFDMVHVDTLRQWMGDHYIIPVAGTWVITLHGGDDPGIALSSITLLIDGYSGSYEVWPSSTGAGADMSSMTSIINLERNSVIRVYNGWGPLYSDSNYQISMVGFLYSPVNLPAVAWFASLSTDTTGPEDPIPFDIEMVDVGDGFDPATYKFTTPRNCNGIYYIFTSGYVWGSTAPTTLELIVNGVVRGNFYTTNVPPGPRTRSRAMILRLRQTDQVWVGLPLGNAVAGQNAPYVITSFGGFRISP